MTLSEAYKYIIIEFEKYIELHNNDGDIISILSDIDCDVWNDNCPNDPATFYDLKKELEKYKENDDCYSLKNTILGLKDFLILYKTKYGFKTDDFEKYISEKNNI